MGGPRRKRFPDNLIATSWHNNIYAPLSALEGGFDLFVIKQANPRQPSPANGGYDSLEPETVNWRGEPNNMFVFEKGEDDQLQCSEMIRNHSRATGTTYAYEMRLRTAYAPVKPIPPLHTLDFGTDGAPKVLISTATAHSSRDEDGLGVGRFNMMGKRISAQEHADSLVCSSTDGLLQTTTPSRPSRALRIPRRTLRAGGGARVCRGATCTRLGRTSRASEWVGPPSA